MLGVVVKILLCYNFFDDEHLTQTRNDLSPILNIPKQIFDRKQTNGERKAALLDRVGAAPDDHSTKMVESGRIWRNDDGAPSLAPPPKIALVFE